MHIELLAVTQVTELLWKFIANYTDGQKVTVGYNHWNIIKFVQNCAKVGKHEG